MNSVANIDNSLAKEDSARHIIKHSTSYRVKSKSEITSLLKKLLGNHTLLSVRINDSSKIFGSMLLELNQEKGYLVLDELYPRNEIKKSLLGDKLSIESQLHGIEIGFSVKVEAIADKAEVEYYKVSYPTSVFHHQRRGSYRVNIGVSGSVPLALSTEDGVLLHAELRDISVDGLSARINSPMANPLLIGDEIPTCIIHSPEGKKILSSLEITRIEGEKPSHFVRVGARFTRISAADKHELSRFIAKQERENIRKLKRLPDAG